MTNYCWDVPLAQPHGVETVSKYSRSVQRSPALPHANPPLQP